ncbi:effector-associated constant component EACC1 [Streptosporangium sp. H16]|uniref:effector-associated constant component EACC1 n=1 Tax=Streptosporangium sp. H16 TaxID=3444184 RepID=UPI003F7B0217
MDIVVTTDAGADRLRELYAWLAEEVEIRGRMRVIERPPPPGGLGPMAEGLQLALGSGGAVAALSGVVIAWLRSRPGEISVKITKGKNQLEVTSKGVKALTAEGVSELTRQLAESLEGEPPRGGSRR